jgi:HKD family nuclease
MLAIGGATDNEVRNALSGVFKDANAISIAVSYIQLSGWKVLEDILGSFDRTKVRLVCTDQLGITDPRAVKKAMDQGVNIRNFAGSQTFHPKLYLATGEGKHTPYMIGSSNLSYPALCRSVEVNSMGMDDGSLLNWFDDLFGNNSKEFDRVTLEEMAKRFTRRLKAQVLVQKGASKGVSKQEGVSSELLDPLFGSLGHEVATLNIDQAGNNVRTLQFALEVVSSANWSGKQKSEMNLLGFATEGKLNALGRAAVASKNPTELAQIWVSWLRKTPDVDLAKIGKFGRLALVKRAFRRFWLLQEDVRNYFLEHCENPSNEEKKVLQTIELVANVGDAAKQISFQEIESLSSLLRSRAFLAPATKTAIDSYLANKGPRGWEVADRKIILEAWKK